MYYFTAYVTQLHLVGYVFRP